MRSRWSDFTEEGSPWGARLGSLLLTVFVPDWEMGMKVVAGEEQMREEILSTAIQEWIEGNRWFWKVSAPCAWCSAVLQEGKRRLGTAKREAKDRIITTSLWSAARLDIECQATPSWKRPCFKCLFSFLPLFFYQWQILCTGNIVFGRWRLSRWISNKK